MMEPLLFLIFLALVAIYNGYEIAYITIERQRILGWFKGRMGELLARYPERVLTAALIGNNFAAVGAAVFLTKWLLKTLPTETAVAGAGLITTVAILLFGEVLPKSFSRQNAEWIIRNLSIWIYITYIVSLPFAFVIQHLITRFVVKVKKEETDYERKAKDEIEKLILRGETRQIITKREGLLMKTALHFYEMKVDWLMVPIKEIVAVPKTKPIKEIVEAVKDRHIKKVVVYDKKLDNVVGVLKPLDILHAFKSKENIENLVKKVPFVYRDWNVRRALEELRKFGEDTAIVVDEYGGVVGLLDYQTVIDELLDVLAGAGISYRKEGGKHIWIVDGDVRVDELAEIAKIDLPTEEETVGKAVLAAYSHMIDEKSKEPVKVTLGDWELEAEVIKDEETGSIIVNKVIIKEKTKK